MFLSLDAAGDDSLDAAGDEGMSSTLLLSFGRPIYRVNICQSNTADCVCSTENPGVLNSIRQMMQIVQRVILCILIWLFTSVKTTREMKLHFNANGWRTIRDEPGFTPNWVYFGRGKFTQLHSLVRLIKQNMWVLSAMLLPSESG